MSEYKTVLDFWFDEIEPALWWRKDPNFDAHLKQRFGPLHNEAAASGLPDWRECAEGRLAEVIVLDQFSRNLFRDDPRAFDWDATALQLAQAAIALKLDTTLPPVQRSFLYMPFMHSESLTQQRQSLDLFARIEQTGNLESAQRHFDVIEQFGRFPHRNDVLSRASTAAELAFLKQPGSSF
ncbi:MAG: DUF924 family protein [Proteobacteria bacterium]|nr:DUF924 family protein [Pseudomonadota bacterium]